MYDLDDILARKRAITEKILKEREARLKKFDPKTFLRPDPAGPPGLPLCHPRMEGYRRFNTHGYVNRYEPLIQSPGGRDRRLRGINHLTRRLRGINHLTRRLRGINHLTRRLGKSCNQKRLVPLDAEQVMAIRRAHVRRKFKASGHTIDGVPYPKGGTLQFSPLSWPR